MSRDVRPDRRQLLMGAAVGGAALLAGCSALDSDGDDTTNGERREVGVTPWPTDELAEEYQAELANITDQLEDGEISQEEAIQLQQGIQAEFQGRAFDELVDRLNDTEHVTIENERSELGAVRVSATASGLIDLLEYPETEALVSVDRLDDDSPAPDPGQ